MRNHQRTKGESGRRSSGKYPSGGPPGGRDVRADDVEKHARRFTKDGLFSSEHTRLYTSMYDQQIAQQMTAGKGLGLAEMMVKQMTPEQPLPEESTPAAPIKFPLETVVRYQNQTLSQLVQKAVPRNYDDSLPGDSKAFLAQLSLPAQLASQQSGATSFDPRSGGAGIWLGTTANPP